MKNEFFMVFYLNNGVNDKYTINNELAFGEFKSSKHYDSILKVVRETVGLGMFSCIVHVQYDKDGSVRLIDVVESEVLYKPA